MKELLENTQAILPLLSQKEQNDFIYQINKFVKELHDRKEREAQVSYLQARGYREECDNILAK